MSRLTGFIFILGVLLIGTSGMLAIDAYMNDDRKEAVRAELNAQLDESAARHKARREDGCRRRCGFFGSMASLVTGLRDGIFKGLPFDPEEALPEAPDGWAAQRYDLALTEAIIGERIQRTGLAGTTSNKLLKHFEDAATSAETGAVRVYRTDEVVLAMAIEISRKGLRAEPKRKARWPNDAKPSAVVVDGLPFLRHAQVSVDPLTDQRSRVDYLHYSMNLDGQVRIDVIARGAEPQVQAFLARLDLEPIVEDLPHHPDGYQPDSSGISTAQVAQQKP